MFILYRDHVGASPSTMVCKPFLVFVDNSVQILLTGCITYLESHNRRNDNINRVKMMYILRKFSLLGH